MKKLLFVCTGNLCRSPLAEGYFKDLLKKDYQKRFHVSSAGTHGTPGAKPPLEACQVAVENGFDISNHLATFLSRKVIDDADMIFAMENGHLESVLLLAPKAKSKTFLLSQWNRLKGYGKDIPDPIGKPLKTYQECLKQIMACVDGLFENLTNGK